MRGFWPIALALLCGACVTLDEPVLSTQATIPGQRTITIVYPAPGPWVISESASKVGSIAESLPVFSSVVASLQEDRDKAAAADLKQYLPPWKPEAMLEPLLQAELAKTGFQGRVIPVAESEIDTATLRKWNRSADTLDWQKKYFYEDPGESHPRDYSRILSLDDALVFEVNIIPSLAADDDGNMIPTLTASSRLVRCQTMHPLFKHEDKVENKKAAKTLYEFKTLPQQLIDLWTAMLPELASQVAASFRPGGALPKIPIASLPGMPAPSASTPTVTTPIPEAPAPKTLPPVP